MVREISSAERFTLNLIKESLPENRCPHFRTDDKGPYCGKNLGEGEDISDKRRMVCDNYSLQLWCLDKERCDKCIVYRGEPI